MKLSTEQFERIKDSLPVERGNVSIGQLDFLNAVLHAVENGCKWRRLPEGCGNWHTLYTRMNRWAKKGVLDRVFARLRQEGIITVRVEVFSLDSTTVKVHPDGTGALKKTGRSQSAKAREDGQQRYIWLPRMIGTRSALNSRAGKQGTDRKAVS
jgi:transposase